MADNQLTTNLVYLDEGEKKGGIAHPTQDLANALRKRTKVEETPIYRPNSFNPAYWYKLGRRASEDADVVHVQFEYGSFGGLNGQFLGIMFPVFASAVDVPIVSTLHNFRDRQVNCTLREPSSFVKCLAEHATWPVDKSLVSNTEFFIPLMKDEVGLLRRHGVSRDHIEHIPLVSETNPSFRDSDACKQKYDLGGNRVVTAFGWIRRSKGYDQIVDALDELPEDVVFLVAGGTRTDEHQAYLDELREKIQSEGKEDRVTFTGYIGREEHEIVMNATDVMVFPYQDNRASDAMARALSYHIPIVASNNEEFSAIEEKWDCIQTAPVNSEFTKTLKNVLETAEKRHHLEEQAKRYTEQMNWGTVADRVVEIYKDARRSAN